MYLLDANVCIAWMRQSNIGVTRRIQAEPPMRLATCSIVLGELYYGTLHSVNPSKHLLLVERLSRVMTSLPFDDQAAETYGHIRQDLSTRGLLIGSNDMLIVAIALVNNLKLVTRNTSEFQRVPNLIVEDWHE